jgi:hypothetical protein
MTAEKPIKPWVIETDLGDRVVTAATASDARKQHQTDYPAELVLNVYPHRR